MSEEMVKAAAYMNSNENFLLVANRDFGRRKFVNVQMNRSISFGKNKNQSGTKKWVHPSEALLRGHIVYNVKFLGHVEVDQPKGIEVVKEAIRKMKFNKQIKRAEGQKPPKVELTISVDGVTVQEPKYKVIQHQYPLHRISYCADDKSDKRMFTFIAKESESNKHHCYVFDSDKCAEEITLTIGQAFDLAYKKFIESSGKDIDMKKQFLLLQKKVQTLTQQNLELKERVADLERLVDPAVLANFDKNKERPQAHTEVSVGRRLENLVMDDGPKTNGTAAPPASLNPAPSVHKQPVPLLAPPPPVPPRQNAGAAPIITSPTSTPQSAPAPAPAPAPSANPNDPVDLFGATPFSVDAPAQPAVAPTQPAFAPAPAGGDPFGMGHFSPSAQELDQQIMNVDRELLDLKAGFSQGLSFGTEDFTLEDLDPLKK